ncbi:hypothetical protein [Microcoleus sp. EPA2]|uniref:hypothetical protein n=1 Tax=Microcoleus sp. EPA2 TaxID=2841654 RepID=UPI00312B9740
MGHGAWGIRAFAKLYKNSRGGRNRVFASSTIFDAIAYGEMEGRSPPLAKKCPSPGSASFM